MNCEALCYGCHMHLTANPYQHEQRKRERIGPLLFDALLERVNDLSLGRQMKGEQKQIAAHYREQARRMEATGETFLEAY